MLSIVGGIRRYRHRLRRNARDFRDSRDFRTGERLAGVPADA
jgi:hypothetical protein